MQHFPRFLLALVPQCSPARHVCEMKDSLHGCISKCLVFISNHLTSLEPGDTCKETYYVLFLIMQVEKI